MEMDYEGAMKMKFSFPPKDGKEVHQCNTKRNKLTSHSLLVIIVYALDGSIHVTSYQ